MNKNVLFINDKYSRGMVEFAFTSKVVSNPTCDKDLTPQGVKNEHK